MIGRVSKLLPSPAVLLTALLLAGCGSRDVELRSPEFKQSLTSGQDALEPELADCVIEKLTAQGYKTEGEVPDDKAEKAGADCAGNDLRSPGFKDELTTGKDALSSEQADCLIEDLGKQGYKTVTDVPEAKVEEAATGCKSG
jgi:hypothetical protein